MKKIYGLTLILLCLIFAGPQLMGQSQYFIAIDNNNMALLEKALAKGKDINYQRKEDGFSPLIYSIFRGRQDFTLRLLEEGCNLELRDKRGNTALLTALNYNQLHTAMMLLEKGASSSVTNVQGFSALGCLARQNNGRDTAQFSLQKKLMLSFIQNGNVLDCTQHTPLILASEQGNILVMKFLVEQGASVDYKTIDEKTAMGQAAMMNQVNSIACLLELGAGIDQLSINGYPPLMLAIENNSTEAAKYLIEAGADLNYKTITYYTPMKSAVIKSNADVIYSILGKTGYLFDLSDSIDADLMASSIIYSSNNRAFAALTKNERYYHAASLAESKINSMANKEDAAEVNRLIDEAVENYQKSYDDYAALEKPIRRKADKISAQNAVTMLATGLLAVTTGMIIVGGYNNDDVALYKIADRYKLQMTVIENKINMIQGRRLPD